MTAAALAHLLFADLLQGRVIVNEMREEKAVKIIEARLLAVVIENRVKLAQGGVSITTDAPGSREAELFPWPGHRGEFGVT